MTQNRATDDTLNDFLAEFEASGEAALEHYVKDHPELAEILYRHAGIARMFKKLPEPELTAEEEQSLNLRASSLVQNILFEFRDQSASHAPAAEADLALLVSLADDLQRVGETFESASKKSRLSPLILKLLAKRKVFLDSIPVYLLDTLAELLGRTREQVSSFLGQKQLGQGGYFKARAAPKVTTQSDFLQLVEFDPDLSKEDKEYWLSIASKK